MTQDTRPFVLIADDDADTLEMLRILAEGKGWRVDTASTAREIIAKVNHHCAEVGHCYDAILSDVNFFDNQPGPRLTGISAIGEIRRQWSHIPVVFYSAYLNTMMRDQITELGNAQALEKGGSGPYGRSVDAVTAIDRVELVLQWVPKRYEGLDRRQEQTEQHPCRRRSDCQGEVRVSHSLLSALDEATMLRQLHAVASGQSSEALQQPNEKGRD